MSQEFIISLAQKAVFTVLLTSAPLVGVALIAGLIISIFQATTSIQEATLAFAPKIVATLIALVIFGPWILSHILEFTSNILSNLYKFIG
ncbi:MULTISPECIES: flagellar biosynthesis protein FliQ [Aneurinibacillus]|uniref:Flagellar biosynthetic protein FliQ n=1 Tax=Aneurinibacillus thermoaerophilus TaxID=143495 RepID=A0A1G7WFM1_ANETH|nr:MULTISPECIES: flagellar biosynthesis protein FliQ [Aneurinibacillus]AMA72682.1 flagellar biosynthetic protein FliQ [Aneurinibacillus sp. XH2]MED0674600.1 flagellar biosynthesis protein FliQ [Aneurinibacillus thermoaerophilus]MED0677969.1 flagellar biosynthesis protein FliQ [Aneurinibacillus thermoaerophilus]MED0736968.1 flagellar biosynthesis protein FliQ [Aneurinibacillus thermoaerophilus]MED0756809.1 flagellar biosynthesis protein FliQ [Aneurinibacillus thermoaerophilus]